MQPAMGCAAAPAILIRTAILTARIAGCTPAPTVMCVALSTTDSLELPQGCETGRRTVVRPGIAGIVLHLSPCTAMSPGVTFLGRCKFNDRISQSDDDRQAHSASITIAGVFYARNVVLWRL